MNLSENLSKNLTKNLSINSDITLRVVVVGALQENCYIMLNRSTKEFLLIDPGDDAKRILKAIKEMAGDAGSPGDTKSAGEINPASDAGPYGGIGCPGAKGSGDGIKSVGEIKLAGILITHAHFDHIGAVAAIMKEYAKGCPGIHDYAKGFASKHGEKILEKSGDEYPKGLSKSQPIVPEYAEENAGDFEELKIPIYACKEELPVFKLTNNLRAMRGRGVDPGDISFLEDGAEIDLCGVRWKLLRTPGHSIGSACWYLPKEGILFSGDTLFKESCGRTDLETGDFKAIVNSIKKVIMSLPDETKVYPGHGEPTSVGYERKHNLIMNYNLGEEFE